MNNALKYVTGKYLINCDIDDILYRDGILDKVLYLESHPEVAMVRNNGYYIKDFNELEKNLFIYTEAERNEENVFENLLYGHTNNWAMTYLFRVKTLFEYLQGRKIYEHPGGQHLQFMLPMSFDRSRLFG